MAEHVEVVIRIPKYYVTHPQDYSCLAECVIRGVLLPKGHGRLIDADAVLEDPYGNTYKDIDIAETIIEADAEE